MAQRSTDQEYARAVGGRLKIARGELQLTQKTLAELAGIALPSQKNYEGGKRIPGGKALAGYARVGINTSWLLDGGDAPMLLDGEIRAAHADLVAALSGDKAAERRYDARADALMVAYRAAQDVVDGLMSEVGYNPGLHTAQGIAVCIYQYGLDPKAARLLLELMRVQSIVDAAEAGLAGGEGI